jgi:hypothetical protein
MKTRLTDEDKIKIIQLYETKSLGLISSIINRPKTTIFSFFKRWTERKKIGNKKPGGRKMKLLQRDNKKIENHLKKYPQTQIKDLKQKFHLNCHYQTLIKTVKKLGYGRHKMARKPLITTAHKNNRLNFARRYLNYQNWNQVLWTDEVSFEVGKSYDKYCWRKRGQRYNPGMFIPTVAKYFISYLKAWACFSRSGPGEIVFLPGDSMNSQK